MFHFTSRQLEVIFRTSRLDSSVDGESARVETEGLRWDG